MKAILAELSKRTMSLISEFASRNDVEAIRLLSTTASQIKKYQDQLDSIERDTGKVKTFLESFSATSISPLPVSESDQGSQGKKLRIEIDWSREGKAGGVEVISDHKSSSSMAKFIQRLTEVRGIETLEVLSQFRISRGPIVSTNPKHDFRNNATGELYAHQEIPGTRFFVLTHSSTTQKVSDLQQVCKFLALPFGMVKVEGVEKQIGRS